MNILIKIAIGFFIIGFLITPAISAERKFAGINFGVGISLTYDLGSNDRVESASLDENNIVRVSEDKNAIARVVLESHYFFEPKNDGRSFLGLTPAGKWGHGPFIALQPGTDEIIEAIGFGWMAGFLRSKEGSDSWNLGLGYIIDPSVKILGDGVEENQALPDGETEIRFKETSQGGLFLLVSFSF
ncbi:MAG: hypothetical protein GY705_28740 [Bacteroidetes bacterium]|nr:hypothetical protein [Bacteroidota bacterium]